MHKLSSWANLIFGFILLLLSFYLIEVAGETKSIFLNALTTSKLHLFLAPLAGALLGNTWRNWGGTKELKLLNEIIDNDENT